MVRFPCAFYGFHLVINSVISVKTNLISLYTLERTTIEGIETVQKLNEAVHGKIGYKKRAMMDEKIKQIMATMEFPTVTDPSYTGYHLPDPLTRAGVKGLMDAARKGQVLHPVYAMRLIVVACKIMTEDESAMSEVTTPEGGSVVVVGDTHGQLTDLLTIFKLVGNPSKKRIFVFNGDFVDRGPHDVNLLLILLAWKILLPKSVYLNRGNHEQRRMNERYAFEKHCRETYKSCVVYELIQQMFHSLPLSTLINQKVLVLHGGLSQYDDVTLDDLRNLPRGELHRGSHAPALTRSEIIRQDLLWSDPRAEEGWAESSRGAGIRFGPDVTRNFVKKNNLELIIRSHEMVDDGYLYWHKNRMVTLFSASNYCGKNENRGAVAIFDHNESKSDNVRDCIDSKPYFHQYYAEVFLDEAETASIPSRSYREECQKETLQKLRERIFQGRHKLSIEFAKLDKQNTGLVNELEWAQTMSKVFAHLPIDWLTLRPYLALTEEPGDIEESSEGEDEKKTKANKEENSTTKKSEGEAAGDENSQKMNETEKEEKPAPIETDPSKRQIKYMKFLDRYKVKVDKKFWATWEQAIIEKICHKLLEHASTIKAAFAAMDVNGNQIIEYDEFVSVLCKFDIGLSKEQIFDFMRTIDKNRDGHVDFEEFAHTFQAQFKSAKDSAKNQEEIDWLKQQMQLISDVIAKKKPSLRSHFKSFDESGDGGLNYEEFSKALNEHLHLKYSEEDALKLARVVDVNGSGRISWKEFKAKFSQVPSDPDMLLVSVLGSVSDAIQKSKTALRTLFYQMDLDGSGKIDIEELRTGLEALNILLAHPLTEDQIKTLHQHIDKDNDGLISYDEFLDSFSIVDTDDSSNRSISKISGSKHSSKDDSKEKKHSKEHHHPHEKHEKHEHKSHKTHKESSSSSEHKE